MHARAAVLLALALGASATNCPTYPCECGDQPGKCIVAGSTGEGGIANKGGVRPYISEEDCNPGMEVIEDPANDGLKCQASKRVFKIDQNGCDGNPACEANCVATCEADPTCKAMIVQTNSCSGFNSALDKTANAGSKAYKKVTATAGKCGGEDVPAGVYCKFTFCPAPTPAPTTPPPTPDCPECPDVPAGYQPPPAGGKGKGGGGCSKCGKKDGYGYFDEYLECIGKDDEFCGKTACPSGEFYSGPGCDCKSVAEFCRSPLDYTCIGDCDSEQPTTKDTCDGEYCWDPCPCGVKCSKSGSPLPYAGVPGTGCDNFVPAPGAPDQVCEDGCIDCGKKDGSPSCSKDGWTVGVTVQGGEPKYTCVCDDRRRLDAPAMPSWAVRSSQRELDTSPALPAWASKGATPRKRRALGGSSEPEGSCFVPASGPDDLDLCVGGSKGGKLTRSECEALDPDARLCGAKCSKSGTYLPTGSCASFTATGAATCDDGCVDCGKDGSSCKDGSEWRVEITGSPATYECVCPPPPPVVCGDCDYCLKISNGDCKTGKSHDTQEKCEEKGDKYAWCGATPEPTVTPQPTAEAPTFDPAAVTCSNYATYETDPNLKVISCKGEDACKDEDKSLDVATSGSKVGVLVICDGKAACSGNVKHKMDAGKVVPVVVLCCGEDACKGSNYKFEVKDWATGVAAYAHCKEKNACTDAKFEVKAGHSLHVKCGGPASKKTCENAKVEVKGSGVATCSGNGCSNLASGYPKRRLDAAAPADTDS